MKEIAMQPEELSEEKLIDINKERGCDKKYTDVSEEVTPAKHFILKELSEIFQNIESTKYKMLEVDSNLERNMTIHQSIEKMLALYHKLYDKKTACTVPTTLDNFYKEIKHYNSQCFNVLNYNVLNIYQFCYLCHFPIYLYWQ